MAQYDGSIIIGTGIDTSGFDKDGKELEAKVKKLGKYLSNSAEIEVKVDASGAEKKFEKVFNDIEKEEKRIEKLSEKVIKKAIRQPEEINIPQISEETRPYTPGYDQSVIEYIENLEKQSEKLRKVDEHYNLLKIDVEEYAKSLKELQGQGKFFGDEDYDKVYLAWKNATDAVKAYQAELNKQTESGQAKIAEQEAKAAERKEAAQRKAEEQAERALQKENARIQKETEREAKLQAAEAERQAKIEAEIAEEERLAQIRENAVVGNQRIIETVERIKQLEQEIADLKAVERTEGYTDYDNRIQELSNLKQVVRDYNNGIEKAKESYKKLGDIAKKALNSIGNTLKKVNTIINNFGKRIKESFSKSASDAIKSANGFGFSLKNILKYGFGIRSLYVLFNKIRSAIKEGFTNLYDDRDMVSFKNSIDNLKASALTLKNAFTAAFYPFVEIAIPYIQKLLDYMVQLVNIAGQFFAAIAGRKTYIRAIKQTTDALKEETQAMNKQLSPLDKLNNLSSQKNTVTDTGASGTMFEEIPIDSDISKIAEKIRDILSKLFEPLKEAWNREGKFVMDSWKYALDEVWKLIKDIGRDFLTVWQQEATVKIFEDLLHIVGDIGLIIGNLARNFRDAWNENKVGLHILENIRDIIGIIVSHIRSAADATVEWSSKLDFYPLLDAFNRFLESLKPVVDAISGILEDFYTKVLLPLGKWVLEKGLPELLQVFIDFNDKVDWETLRENLAEFWEHLEPFAETIGEGLIIFIERVSSALADFVNSQEFKDFLVTLENWMDSVSPEDVADALELIAKGLIALKVALLGFSAISAIAGIFTTITTFIHALSGLGGIVASAASSIASGIGSIISAVGGIIPILASVAAAVVGWHIGSWIAEKLDLDPKPFNETMSEIKSSFTDGTWKEALNLWGDDIYNAFVLLGERQAEKFGEIKENISETWSDIKETALEKWNDIKESLSEAWGSIKKTASEKWESILSTISDTVDKVKEKIDGFISKIEDAIQSIKDFFASGFEKIGSSVSGLFGGGKSGSSRSSTYSAPSTFSTYSNPAFAAIQTAEIPRLATGAVIPANREFLAVLGDQKRGTNVEAPLEMIKQANKEGFMEILNQLGLSSGGNSNNGGGNNTYEFSVDGQVFFRIMQKYADEYRKRHGKYAFG